MAGINTLYLVDDDSTFQFLTRKIIEQTKLVDNVKLFGNGLEAINSLRTVSDSPEKLPDVILLDLNMPVMDGWEFIEEYNTLKKQIGKKINLFILSSSIAENDLEKAKSFSQVTDYIVKPVTKDRFKELLSEV